MRRFAFLLSGIALGATLTSFAAAQTAATASGAPFPTKAVRLIVPFAAGGSTDIIGRAIGQKLGELWGQPVVVDNRPGGNTTIATELVARAAPDGHTLLVTPAPFTIVPSLTAKLPYDPQRDFEPVTLVNTTPLVLVVNPRVPAKSVKELIALAKAKPGMLNFGSSGAGGSNHLAGELFNAMAGVKIVHIPYRGNAPALTDLVGGHIDIIFNGLTSAMPLVKSGKLRPLAVTSLQRASALPEIATLDELGLKGFQAGAWNGLTAPAGTPRDTVNKISRDVVKILGAQDFRERLRAEGSDAVGNTPQEFRAFLAAEITKWNKVIRFANVKLQ